MNRDSFSTPGNYRVVVQGRLGTGWSDRLGSMRVLAHSPEADSEVTVLQGRVSDQAELSGILNTLYDLHLPLISVQFLDESTLTEDQTE